MKKYLVILIGIFLFSCNQQKKNTSERFANNSELNKVNENFDWLVGNWKRLSNDSVKVTFENWAKEVNGRFIGHGFILKGSDTIWQEKMLLAKKDSMWTLEVKTPENNDLVRFVLTKYDSSSFTVENPKHDFPKEIKYWKNEEKLNALISGDGNEISFEFERLK